MSDAMLTARPAWKLLAEQYRTVRGRHMRQLFAEDAHRGERYTAEAAGIYLDYSKNRSTNALIRRYLRLRESRA